MRIDTAKSTLAAKGWTGRDPVSGRQAPNAPAMSPAIASTSISVSERRGTARPKEGSQARS